MRLFKRGVVATNDIAAPLILQDEMIEQATVVNGGIDADNIPDGVLTSGKVATGAWNNVNRQRSTTAVVVTGSADTATGTWINVPGASTTDPLDITIQTQDSALQIETSGKYDNNDLVNDTRIIVAITVDGAREVISGEGGAASFSSWSLSALVLVGAGEHTVGLQFAFVDVLGTGKVGVAWSRDFAARQLWVREVKR